MQSSEPCTFELEPDEEYDKFCGKVFVTTKKKIIFHCTLCESKFFGFENYVNHVTSQHLKDDSFIYSSSQEGEYLESDGSDEIMTSDEKLVPIENQQQKTTESKTKMNNSKKKVQTDFPPLPVLTEVEDRSRPTQIVLSEKGVFGCPHCPQRFPLEWSLKAHLKEHETDRVFKCDICGVQFKLHRLLRVHLKRHEKNKPFKCTECDRSFIAPSELQYHMRNHTGEKPYQCEDCGVRYAYNSNLVLHRKRHHTFQKDYVCPICSEAFYCGRFLRDHMSKHTNEPSYECDKCGKKFNTSGNFQVHKRKHRQQEQAQTLATYN